jgi:hypothetical protein
MEPDIRKHVKAAAILRAVAIVLVVSCLLMVSQCFTYDATVMGTKDQMRSLGERFVFENLTLEEAEAAIYFGEFEKVREDEFRTVRRVDHWLNVLEHKVYLQIKFREKRAVEFRVYDFALAL